MGLIKDLFLKVVKKYCRHKEQSIVYSLEPKQSKNKGELHLRIYRYDIYEIKRCTFCKKDVKERIIKHGLTEKQAIEFVDGK